MIVIDLDSPTPLTDQIVQAIRRAIALGRVRPGGELPTVRQLAADLDVNFNTVSRAYRLLEASGLVRTSRGRGTRVIADREAEPQRAGLKARAALENAVADARLAGMGREDLSALIRLQIEALWGPAATREGES